MEPSANHSALEEAVMVYEAILADGRPSSLTQCAMESKKAYMMAGVSVDAAVVHPKVYRDYIQKRDELADAEEAIVDAIGVGDEGSPTKKARSPRTRKAVKCFYTDDDGTVHILKPTETSWYLIYLKSPDVILKEPKYAKKFKR